MEEKKEKKLIKFQNIFYVTVILLLLFLSFVLVYVSKEKEMFMSDPAIYGLNKRFDGQIFDCSCNYELRNGEKERIGFNNTNSYYLQKWYPFL